MRMSRIALLLVCALLAATVVAQQQVQPPLVGPTDAQTGQQRDQQKDQMKADQQQRTGQQMGQMQTQDQSALMMHRATEVIGSDVRNSQDEDLGTVSDIVLDSSLDRASYAVLSYGGVLGVGAKRFAVPWQAVQFKGKDQPVMLNTSKSQLDDQPGFGDNWPDQPTMQISAPGAQPMGQTGVRTYDVQRSDQGVNIQRRDSGTGGTGLMGTQGTGPGSSTYDVQRTDQGVNIQRRDSGTGGTGLMGTQGTGAGVNNQSRDTGTGIDTQRQSSGMAGQRRDTSGMSSQRTDQGSSAISPLDSMQRSQDSSGQMYGSRRAPGWATSVDDRRVSEIIGTDVKNPQDSADLGQIEDLVISQDGRVVYGIVSYGGTMGMNEKLAAIPWTELDFQEGMNVAHLDTSRAVLDRLAFDDSSWPDFSSRQYGRRVHENFNTQPYWEQQQMQTDPSKGWTPGCPYQQSFQPQQMKTTTGTIESVGSFHPEQGAYSGLRLRIRDDQGRLMTVHAGPKQFVQDQNFSFNRGDKVTVTGSQSSFNGTTVVMATTIQKDDKTLQLRDDQGNPKWDVSKMGTGMEGQQRMQGGQMNQGQMNQSGQGGQSQ